FEDKGGYGVATHPAIAEKRWHAFVAKARWIMPVLDAIFSCSLTRRLSALFSLLVFVLVLLPAIAQSRSDQLLRGIVVRAIDGISIEASVDGRPEIIRYIGIGTPDFKPPTPDVVVTCAEDARSTNSRLVEGKAIRITLDAQERDGDGRLLGFVF